MLLELLYRMKLQDTLTLLDPQDKDLDKDEGKVSEGLMLPKLSRLLRPR